MQEDNIGGHENTCTYFMQELCNIGTIETFRWSFMGLYNTCTILVMN